jgi:hypothetical protein
MMPAQAPAKRFCFAACCLTELVADALALGFGLGARFGFGLMDCSGVGVGLSISEIGAGRRCAVAKSNAATSVQPNVRRKIDILRLK